MRVLRETSGVSLLFVLAAMMLLMVVGASAITAAGMSAGAGFARRDGNQLRLWVGGMERTVKAALTEDPTGESVTGPRTLGGWILREAYLRGGGRHMVHSTFMPEVPDEWEVTYSIGISADMRMQIFPPILRTVWEEEQGAGSEGPENPEGGQSVQGFVEVAAGRSPQRAMIDGLVTVTQTTAYTAPGGNCLCMTTSTTYQYCGGVIEESDFNEMDPDVHDENMRVAEPGAWKVIKHE